MGRVLVELGRVSAGQIADVAAEFDHGGLHAEAQAEERNAFGAGVANGHHFAFDAALAEAAGDEDSVVAAEQAFGAFGFEVFALNAADADLGAVADAGVVERFVDRFVGVVVLGVLADDGDADLGFGVTQPLKQIVPVVEVRLVGFEAELVADEFIELVFDEAERHFVDREVFVLFLDDGFELDVAEEGDFFAVFAARSIARCGR